MNIPLMLTRWVYLSLIEDDLPPLTLVAADDDLLKAAQSERLETENPNHYP